MRLTAAVLARQTLVVLATVAALSCAVSTDSILPTGHPAPPTRVWGATARRYIVTIATNTYAGATTLSRPEADAADIERAFVDHLGFETKAGLRLWGDEATTAAINALIGPQGDIQGLGADAMVVVYIALHGASLPCGKDGRCTWLMTRDAASSAKGIEVAELLRKLAQRTPHHITVLLDACAAGVAVGLEINDLDYTQLVPKKDATGKPVAPSEAYRPVARRSRKVLTSAGAAEDAADGSTERAGPFAESLLRGLRGEADLYPDGWLLFTELAVYLQAEVTWLTGGRQQPESGGFSDDERGTPIIGPLLLTTDGVVGDSDALLAEAGTHVERGEIHQAIRVLRQSLSALTERALAERQRLHEAEALAAAGNGPEAIALLDQPPRSTRGAADPALVVRRQVQVLIARETGQPADEVARLEARAAEAGLDVAARATNAAGRVRLMSSLGGVAMVIGASQVAGGLAGHARAAAEASGDLARVAVLAGNEAAAFTAAGDTARAAAAREVEQAAVEVSQPPTLEPAAPTAAIPPEPVAELAPLPAVQMSGRWPAMEEPFIEGDSTLTPLQRLALARAWAARVGERDPKRIVQVERFGRLLAAVERARLDGVDPAQAAEARAVVLDAMWAMFPRPADVDDAALTGRWVALPGREFDMDRPPGGRLSPFALAEAEVTAGQFRRLVPEHGPSDADALPARNVSWYASTAYAEWVGARLPTAAEWEFASRWRGEGLPMARTRYCGWDREADLDRVGWYDPISGGDPHPVKQRAACGGLYDLNSNVWEWTGDWFGGDRIFRGGSWDLDSRFVRSAYRDGWQPVNRYLWLGFRLARSAPSGS